ncbi:MAG: hypothetical protein M1830_005635 [Pleopsidium flavum]|nr:MAG: hypothetical protein M1830_005635 [Pleopsidium flavum]
MSSDDQYFLDMLSSIPNDVKKYSLELADAIERQTNSVSAALRESLQSATWIPQSVKPPRPPPRRVVPAIPQGYIGHAQEWVLRHQALTAAILAFLGTGGFLVYRKRKLYGRKRRAKRASNGARKEVVVIAGSPNEPITRSLSLDLERRGFVVYVVVSTVEEEQLVRNESRVDIHPLNLDIVDPTSTEQTINHFTTHLLSPRHAFPNSTPHTLTLAGVILIPDTTYPSGPIETLSPSLWSDTLNTKILATTTTTRAFLRPLLSFHARLLLLTPSIIPSLAPPFHAIEAATVAALDAFTSTLRAELAPANVPVISFKLGTFDCGAVGGRTHLQSSPEHATRADILSWPSSVRATYAKNYVAQSSAGSTRGCINGGGNGGGVKGSPLRELHNGVFDALTVKRPKNVWHVGNGSLVYDVVGKWVPAGIVGWMLGIRSVGLGREEGEEGGEVSVEWEKVERMV